MISTIVLAPDSFKSSMNATTVCDIMAKAILEHCPNMTIRSLPMADGGEGTVDCLMQAFDGKKVQLQVNGPNFKPVDALFAMLTDDIAVIEMASAAGYMLADRTMDVATNTTYGVGELIKAAMTAGAKQIYVGLGGSCTNDGGVGAAAALGVQFLNKENESFVPTGATLHQIEHIVIPQSTKELLHKTKITTLVDVDNPLYGRNGAAYIFAPQKGANSETVKMLDDGLRHLEKRIKNELGIDVSSVCGGGAAGGMGAGMKAFLNSEIEMGTEAILKLLDFDKYLSNADLVITGEGRLDAQTLFGKVVIGVAKHTQKHKVPLIAIAGDVEGDSKTFEKHGVQAVFSTNQRAVPFEKAKQTAAQDLYTTVENLMKLIKIFD